MKRDANVRHVRTVEEEFSVDNGREVKKAVSFTGRWTIPLEDIAHHKLPGQQPSLPCTNLEADDKTSDTCNLRKGFCTS